MSIRLTASERARLEAKARAAGLRPTEYARRVVLGHSIVAKSDRIAIKELGRVGGLLKWFLSGGYGRHSGPPEIGRCEHPGDRRFLEAVLTELRELLGRLAPHREASDVPWHDPNHEAEHEH